MNRTWIIVSGRETPDVLSAMEQGVIDRCRDFGLDCLLVPPLYHVSDSSSLWKQLARRVGRAVLFCWLHPRPAQWLLEHHGIASAGLAIFDLGSFADADSAARAAIENRGAEEQGSRGAGAERAAGDKGTGPCFRPSSIHKTTPAGRKMDQSPALERFAEPTRPRWYPIVDGSRCINCQHCLQFCLFGVYELDARGKVAVSRPDQCKPGCPACSRICPQGAIMFPLYEKDAAIAGAPGRLVTLDAAARKMFYTQTGQRCPVCGTNGDGKPAVATAAGSTCPECGRPQSTPAADPLPFDDLDDLVDQLGRQMHERRPG